MANRVSTLNTFASLSPPWLLSSLDQNSSFITTGFNDSSLGWSNGVPTDTGSANVYSVALPYGSPTAYNPGMLLYFLPANGNSGASTMTVPPLGAAAIVNKAGVALSGGEIIKGKLLGLVYDGTSFRMFTWCAKSVSAGGGGLGTNCNGYDAIVVNYTMSSTSGIVLHQLGAGTAVVVEIGNFTGSPQTYSVSATTPEADTATGYNIGWTPMANISGNVPTVMQNGATISAFSLGTGQQVVFKGIPLQTAPSTYTLQF